MTDEVRTSQRGGPSGRRRYPTAATSVTLTAGELQSLARLEGQPLPRSETLAEILGVSRNSAWRFVRRLRREGVLGFATRLRAEADVCECVSYVKVNWSGVQNADEVDDLFRQDPCVIRADRITGTADYRLVSHHVDYRAAHAWSRMLMVRPSVAHVTSKICKTIIDRSTYAQARLAAETAARPLRGCADIDARDRRNTLEIRR